jgi:zinc/manganese transport system substrate-binding protein
MSGRWLAALGAIVVAMTAPVAGQEKIGVVATFSILADLAKNVGGDAIEVTALVGADSDAHAYSPTPADAKRLADAKLVL